MRWRFAGAPTFGRARQRTPPARPMPGQLAALFSTASRERSFPLNKRLKSPAISKSKCRKLKRRFGEPWSNSGHDGGGWGQYLLSSPRRRGPITPEFKFKAKQARQRRLCPKLTTRRMGPRFRGDDSRECGDDSGRCGDDSGESAAQSGALPVLTASCAAKARR